MRALAAAPNGCRRKGERRRAESDELHGIGHERAKARCPPARPPVECPLSGDVAQLGERRVRNAKVGSSILLVSTKEFKHLAVVKVVACSIVQAILQP